MDLKPIKHQLFRKAYEGLANQGFKQAATRGGTCMYRADDGLKCAVGHIIDSDEEANFFDGIGDVTNIWRKYRELRDRFMEAIGLPQVTDDQDRDEIIQFLWSLQRAHDEHSKPEGMKEELTFLAGRWELEVRS